MGLAFQHFHIPNGIPSHPECSNYVRWVGFVVCLFYFVRFLNLAILFTLFRTPCFLERTILSSSPLWGWGPHSLSWPISRTHGWKKWPQSETQKVASALRTETLLLVLHPTLKEVQDKCCQWTLCSHMDPRNEANTQTGRQDHRDPITHLKTVLRLCH